MGLSQRGGWNGGMLEMSNETSYSSRHLAKTIIWQIKWLNLFISVLMSICASVMIEEALWLHGDTEDAQVFPVASDFLSDLIYFWAAWFVKRGPDMFPLQRIPESLQGCVWNVPHRSGWSDQLRRSTAHLADWCSLFLSGVKFTKWCMD